MNEIRLKFPIFAKHQNKLAYLDTAASAQKPESVIQRLLDFYSGEYSNIHRGAYSLSAIATQNYEKSRSHVAKFLNANSPKEIVFTRNATEGINLVANCLLSKLKNSDTILITELEHHSNIVPWQIQAEKFGLSLQFVKITKDAQIDLEDFKIKLEKYRPKICSFTMQSNAFGTVTPYQELVRLAKNYDCLILLDACQIVAHRQIDLQDLDVDFLVFSGHKIYGPTGIGVLYAKAQHLESFSPYQGGGEMISSVSVTGSTWAEIPARFEAGTPAIAEAIALETAIEFMEGIGWEEISSREDHLSSQAKNLLSDIGGIEIYGQNHSSIISFNLNGVHPHDLASICDQFNVQIRAGFHCAMPAVRAMGLHSSARISFGVYNQESDLMQLQEALLHAKKIFKV